MRGQRGAAFATRAAALACLAFALLAPVGCAPAADAPTPHASTAARPQRIVSLNLCTDQLLMQMVEPHRIRAVTYLASDPRSSAMADAARALPATTGSAEDVIARQPDLVLAGTYSTRQTVALLQQLGYRVVTFEPETDIASIVANIRKLADAVGEPARGEVMVREIEAALANLPPAPSRRPVYADYAANGYTSGRGGLLSQLANLAGFDMLGERLGFDGMRQVSLEQMLVIRPDVIDLGSRSGAPALANEHVRHPALGRVLEQAMPVAIPSAYTTCGSVLSLRALDALVDARRALP